MDTRDPCVAGQFYEGDPNKLKLQLQQLFEEGAGLPKVKKWSQTIAGGIVPHAGYMFSGRTSAYFYKELAETYLTNKRFELMSDNSKIRRLNTVVLLGPSHSSFHADASVFDKGNWLTPLGRTAIDSELAKQLIDNAFFKSCKSAHQNEHSLEVQLPFLQFLFKEEMPKILPIVFSTPFEIEVCRKYGEKLADAIKESGKEVVIITSSDFTHYGFSYNYLPFHGTSAENKKNVNKLDNEALEHIRNLDAPAFIRYVKQTGATICGRVPIAIQLFALSSLGSNQGKVLNYTASGDMTGDWSSSVSYASVKFE